MLYWHCRDATVLRRTDREGEPLSYQLMGFLGRLKALLRGLLMRIGLLLGGAVLIGAVWFNFNAGTEILAGLLSPDALTAIVVSVARR